MPIDPLVKELNSDPETGRNAAIPGVLSANITFPRGPQPSDSSGVPGGATGEELDPLEVKPKPREASPVKRLDAKHSLAVGGKGFRVLLRGEYYAGSQDSQHKIIKQYELEFNLPHLDAALSKIVKHLLLPALKKKYPDAIYYRTHQVVEATPLSAETPATSNLQYMTRAQLIEHIDDESIPVNPAEYDGVVDLRFDVIDFTLNPKGFAERQAKRQAERREKAELQQLNPDVEMNLGAAA